MVRSVEPLAMEYLVHHGCMGDLGRFHCALDLFLRRGDRVVVQEPGGLVLGEVLCAATPRHARLLPEHTVGELLRRADAADEAAADEMRQRGQQLLDEGQRLAAEFSLPMELIDVEVQLDGQRALLHHLRWAPCDERPLISTLSRKYALLVAMHDLAPQPAADHGGCGKPGCGKSEGGGCSNCGTGGGCATGCGSVPAKDLKEYFLGLRQQMEQKRTPLL